MRRTRAWAHNLVKSQGDIYIYNSLANIQERHRIYTPIALSLINLKRLVNNYSLVLLYLSVVNIRIQILNSNIVYTSAPRQLAYFKLLYLLRDSE